MEHRVPETMQIKPRSEGTGHMHLRSRCSKMPFCGAGSRGLGGNIRSTSDRLLLELGEVTSRRLPGFEEATERWNRKPTPLELKVHDEPSSLRMSPGICGTAHKSTNAATTPRTTGRPARAVAPSKIFRLVLLAPHSTRDNLKKAPVRKETRCWMRRWRLERRPKWVLSRPKPDPFYAKIVHPCFANG